MLLPFLSTLLSLVVVSEAQRSINNFLPPPVFDQTKPNYARRSNPTHQNNLFARTGTPYGQIPLQSTCGYIFVTGSTFSIGASALVGASIGLNNNAGEYSGSGLGTLVMGPNGDYSTSPAVNGKVYASSYNAPTPQNLTQAIADEDSAYNYARSEGPVTQSFAGAGALDSLGMLLLILNTYSWLILFYILVFQPGIYRWGAAVTLTTS